MSPWECPPFSGVKTGFHCVHNIWVSCENKIKTVDHQYIYIARPDSLLHLFHGRKRPLLGKASYTGTGDLQEKGRKTLKHEMDSRPKKTYVRVQIHWIWVRIQDFGPIWILGLYYQFWKKSAKQFERQTIFKKSDFFYNCKNKMSTIFILFSWV